MKALVVDDSRSMRAILTKQLRELGFEVREASGGAEALRSLHQEGPVDLVLLDWNMPEMDGAEVLALIRSEPLYKGVRVMMVTTESEMSQVSVALEAGANEYLMKPFDRESLVEKLILLGMDPSGRAV
ncbi:MAG TPA: response regulator [Acidobacteriota bacterium]|jgi:two-component system chemotaxis response regulator CheY|nr:response regulator [Acidobacteriota bacterium]